MKFEQNFKIGIREVGRKNEITNYGILAFLEDLATYHSDTVGYGVKDVFSKNRAWLLMDWELEVYKRPKFGDVIKANTSAVSLEKPTYHCYRNFEVFDENDNLVATATSKWLLFDTEKNKIVKIDADTMKLFNPEENSKKSEEKILKLKDPEEYDSIFQYQVQRADIDMVQHMNNLNYLKLAYEAIPEDLFFGNELNNVRIMYKHQIKLGDTEIGRAHV